MTVVETTSTVNGGLPRADSPATSGTALVGAQPSGISQAARCFDEVQRLQAGWNGRTARPLSPVALSRAVALLSTFWRAAAHLPDNVTHGVALPPQVFPRPSGGVQFEWHAGDAHLEVAVEPDGEALIAAESGAMEIDCEVDLDPYWPGLLPDPAVAVLGEIFTRVWNARLAAR